MRLGVPLLILRWPLLGGLLSIGADYIDLQLLQALDPSQVVNYQPLDKTLDLYYMSLEALVALRWKNEKVKIATLALFFYRLLGTVFLP